MAARAETRRDQPAADDAADTLLDLQHRYLQAWREANQIMLDAMQAVSHRQAELADQGLREFWVEPAATQDGSGEARTFGRLERAQGFYQQAFSGFQELSEILLKAQSDAMRVLAEGVATGTETSRKAA